MIQELYSNSNMCYTFHIFTEGYPSHHAIQPTERCKPIANQAIETPKAIILTDEWGDKLIDGNGEQLVPDNIQVGAMIKFTTIRDDGMCVRSTGFVVEGGNSHLTIKDYMGNISGNLNVIQCNRECLTCWEDNYDALHEEEECPGAVTFDGLEYVNDRGMNFGQVFKIEVTNPKVN